MYVKFTQTPSADCLRCCRLNSVHSSCHIAYGQLLRDMHKFDAIANAILMLRKGHVGRPEVLVPSATVLCACWPLLP
jgi:hypothetical protein